MHFHDHSSQRHNALLALLTILIVLFGIMPVMGWAQDARTQTFPLHKEFPATVVLCLDQKAAEDIANAELDNSIVVVMAKAMTGECATLPVLITYKKLVHKGQQNVYEATVATEEKPVTVYAVTPWNHARTNI